MFRISWIGACLALVSCASVPSASTGQHLTPATEQARLVRLCADYIDSEAGLNGTMGSPKLLNRSDDKEAQIVTLTLIVLIPKGDQPYRQEVRCTISTEEPSRVVAMVFSFCGEGC